MEILLSSFMVFIYYLVNKRYALHVYYQILKRNNRFGLLIVLEYKNL